MLRLRKRIIVLRTSLKCWSCAVSVTNLSNTVSVGERIYGNISGGCHKFKQSRKHLIFNVFTTFMLIKAFCGEFWNKFEQNPARPVRMKFVTKVKTEVSNLSFGLNVSHISDISNTVIILYNSIDRYEFQSGARANENILTKYWKCRLLCTHVVLCPPFFAFSTTYLPLCKQKVQCCESLSFPFAKENASFIPNFFGDLCLSETPLKKHWKHK